MEGVWSRGYDPCFGCTGSRVRFSERPPFLSIQTGLHFLSFLRSVVSMIVVVITLYMSRGGPSAAYHMANCGIFIFTSNHVHRKQHVQALAPAPTPSNSFKLKASTESRVLFGRMHSCHTLVARPPCRPWHQDCAQVSASLWRKHENSQTKVAGILVPSHRATQTCSRILTLQRPWSLKAVPMLRICSRTHTLWWSVTALPTQGSCYAGLKAAACRSLTAVHTLGSCHAGLRAAACLSFMIDWPLGVRSLSVLALEITVSAPGQCPVQFVAAPAHSSQ